MRKKVLWFTNSVMPAAFRNFKLPNRATGPWMWSLLESLTHRSDLDITVAAISPGMPDTTFSENGVSYRLIGQARRFQYWTESTAVIGKIRQVVDDVAPDIVHIHGTELPYGMISRDKDYRRPTIVSLQGLLGPLSKKTGDSLHWRDQVRATTLLEAVRGLGVINQAGAYGRRGRRERAIVGSCRYFMGRTAWDRAFVEANQPRARYFHVGEVLRGSFYERAWEIENCDPFTVIFTNVSGPIKGADILLEAIAIVKRDFPQVKLRLAGRINDKSGYGKYLLGRIKDLGLSNNLEILGYLDEEQMAGILLRTNLYVTASYCDNSPNSLAEAQVMGVPCIATAVGGVLDMVDDRRSGLLVPPGDPEILAWKIKSVLQNPDLAQTLSANAREIAQRRHNRESIVESLMTAYRATISGETDV
ncbi:MULTISPECIES: glycosyltransferase family 4 protein [Cupriavidus]